MARRIFLSNRVSTVRTAKSCCYNPTMLRAHKIELKPTTAQVNYFARACGTARFAWNWALAEWNCQYKGGDRPNEGSLRKLLNSIKRQQFPWMLEVTKFAPA